MAQKRYLFTPGPTPVPPQVLAALSEPVLHHRAPDFRIVYERTLQPAPGGSPDERGRPSLHLLGHRRLRVGDRQPLLARRPRARRLGRPVRRALGGDGPGLRLRGRGAALRVGRDADRRRAHAQARRARAGLARLPRPFGDLDGRRLRPAGACGRREGGRRARRRGRGLEPRRRPARDRRLGARRRRRRLAEGADDPAGTRHGRRLRGRVGARGALDAASLLPRLGANAEGAGQARQRVHARRLARRGARCRPRPAARGGTRRRLRAPCPARARLPRRDQGDGARALLARRGALGCRHRRLHARWARLVGADARAPRPARDHDRRRPGRAEGEDLPDRAHRLLRRVRHRDGAFGRRARARRARRPDRARARRHAGARGVRRRSPSSVQL